jgi:thiol-disulfide isomerase/thioredoxin
MKRFWLALLLTGCASAPVPPGAPASAPAAPHDAHAAHVELCEHQVPKAICTQCHPDLAPDYQRIGDWCAEHTRPESQCLICHPELTFTAHPEVPDDADVKWISNHGEDVPSLAEHAATGKVTLFDFYADWCTPCRKIDDHVFALLRSGAPIAVRKVNIVSWETPVAKRHLTRVSELPYVVVYDGRGSEVRAITGLDLAALDRAIEDAKSR